MAGENGDAYSFTMGLQWGRGGLPADGSAANAGPIRRRTRFNGAAGVCPRMARLLRWTVTQVDPCFNGAAGVCPRMGDSSMSRSKPNRKLQWGRGGLPADGPYRLGVKKNLHGLLQWGRGGLPADGRCRRTTTASSARFNGAAGVCPRMDGKGEGSEDEREAGFNGAAGVCPRMEQTSKEKFLEDYGFNGAAGVCPRMAGVCVEVSVPIQALQWGRGGLPADGAWIWEISRIRILASMGPRGFARGWRKLCPRQTRPSTRFNGAAGVCPRMVQEGLNWSSTVDWLQWGRGGLPADGRLHDRTSP